MLEAQFYTADAKKKGAVTLPAEFDGVVKEGALYHAVRAYRNNQRQGTQSTKTRSEVSGGNAKPWRQKGTGRARQGSTRAPNWVGGGIALGPKPRSHRTALPQKVRRLARRSALNARAAAGAIHVIEGFQFTAPRTRQLAELLTSLGLAGRKVLILTAETDTNLHLSGRNLPGVHVMRYRDAAAYDVLWSDDVLVAQDALGEVAAAPKRKRAAKPRTAGGATKRTKAAAPKARKPAAKTTRTRKTKREGGDA